MKKVFKWFGIILGVVLGLVLAVVVASVIRTNSLLTQEWEFVPDSVQIPTDAEAVSRGQYFTNSFHVVCRLPWRGSWWGRVFHC